MTIRDTDDIRFIAIITGGVHLVKIKCLDSECFIRLYHNNTVPFPGSMQHVVKHLVYHSKT